jgi:hypothetical protein
MNAFIEGSRGAVGAPSKRLVLLIFGALALTAVVSAWAWQEFDSGERGAASGATASTGAVVEDLAALHTTAEDSGRLTVYLVGSPEEAGPVRERIAAAEEFRAQNWASPLNASVVIVGSPDEERQAQAWATAMNDGLGVPVDVIDLRRSAHGERRECPTTASAIVTYC